LNLKNNQITMKELLANPAAKALLQKKFPSVMNHPLAAAAGTITLAQAIELARVYAPRVMINEILRELENL